MSNSQKRNSSIELLRIIAMAMVLIFHAVCFSYLKGVPTVEEVRSAPIGTIFSFLTTSLSAVCVNVFVLISGWFGIHFKPKRLLSLVFQVLFFAILVYGALLIYDWDAYWNISGWAMFLLQNSGEYWFVKEYILLMLLSPMLNAFVENASKRHLELFLILFYTFQTIYGWFFINGSSLAGGYSALSFVGLYLLASYLHKYIMCEGAIYWAKQSFYFYFSLYLGIATILAIAGYAITYLGFPISGRLYTYTSPLAIVEAICLLLAFTRIDFQSRAINWIAASCFAVYLLHGNEFLLRPFYGKTIRIWFSTDATGIYLLKTSLFIIICYIAAVLIDKIRIWIWNKLCSNKRC